MFQLEEKKGVAFLTVPAFTETGLIHHGFTTRIGGVSEPPYHSLNMGLHVGDEASRVKRNRERVSQILAFPLENLVAAKQVHGDQVAIITSSHRGRGAFNYESALDGVDALITAEPGVPLSTYYADCVPLLVLDLETPAIGLAHAGWKGTALRIGAKTIKKMEQSFGTQPQNCLVAIGPSIGPCCYEVDSPVRMGFLDQFPDSIDFFQKVGEDRWLLDLWTANQVGLKEVGVPEHNIFLSRYCTACRPDHFFSYRKEGGSTGRMAALMMLRP